MNSERSSMSLLEERRSAKPPFYYPAIITTVDDKAYDHIYFFKYPPVQIKCFTNQHNFFVFGHFYSYLRRERQCHEASLGLQNESAPSADPKQHIWRVHVDINIQRSSCARYIRDNCLQNKTNQDSVWASGSPTIWILGFSLHHMVHMLNHAERHGQRPRRTLLQQRAEGNMTLKCNRKEASYKTGQKMFGCCNWKNSIFVQKKIELLYCFAGHGTTTADDRINHLHSMCGNLFTITEWRGIIDDDQKEKLKKFFQKNKTRC